MSFCQLFQSISQLQVEVESIAADALLFSVNSPIKTYKIVWSIIRNEVVISHAHAHFGFQIKSTGKTAIETRVDSQSNLTVFDSIGSALKETAVSTAGPFKSAGTIKGEVIEKHFYSCIKGKLTETLGVKLGFCE